MVAFVLTSVTVFDGMRVTAVEHLSSSACGLRDLVAEHGEPGFYKDVQNGSSMCNFQSLAKAIVYQQLAGAAASTIWNRLLGLASEGQVCVQICPENNIGV